MAKGFPYFKFIATEWLTGDIVYESFELQGLFINICALYWQRDGNLSIEDIEKRYKTKLHEQLINRFINVKDGFISIKFLDEQLIDANHVSKVNSENGKKGAEAKKKKAKAKRPLSEGSANLSKEEEEVNKSKVKVRELVLISPKEHEELRKTYSETDCNWMYDKLNNYKLSSGKKYKSDYGAINSWVKEELKKHRLSNPVKTTTKELGV